MTAHREHSSWMTPEAKSGDLLYVSEYGGGVVDVFSYPRGKLVGELGGFSEAEGECVDRQGDVWIVNPNLNQGQPMIEEFAHGGTTPIGSVVDSGQFPYACGVDPRTGDLAVTNESGGLALYKNAQGSPSFYSDPKITLMLWCGFDAAGNLFVDGLTRNAESQLAELPKGKTTFTNITLNQSLGFPGNIQWDGAHITVGDVQYQNRDTSAIYQVQVSGSAGTVVGTTVLNGSKEVFGSWIRGKRVIAPQSDGPVDVVEFWPYPAGGNATKMLSKGGGFNGPFGAAVSPARV